MFVDVEAVANSLQLVSDLAGWDLNSRPPTHGTKALNAWS